MQSEHAAGDDISYLTAIEQGYRPIRDVARVTGVNAVTLRAWERRYGLVVPQRTSKGHRLYSPQHIERIQSIVTWLERGVAVSQIKVLLDDQQAVSPAPSDDWQHLRSELTECVAQLAERRLDERFNRVMALYPTRTLIEQLLWPLLDELQQRWRGQFGAALEQAFFHTWLRNKFAARLYHNNRQASGAPVLLAGLDQPAIEPGLWLCAWLLSDSGCPLQLLDSPLPIGELLLAQERIAPRALLLYAGHALSPTQVQRQLPRLASHATVPILLVGPAAHIHRNELSPLPLAGDPLMAHAWMQRQGLLDANEEFPCNS